MMKIIHIHRNVTTQQKYPRYQQEIMMIGVNTSDKSYRVTTISFLLKTDDSRDSFPYFLIPAENISLLCLHYVSCVVYRVHTVLHPVGLNPLYFISLFA